MHNKGRRLGDCKAERTAMEKLWSCKGFGLYLSRIVWGFTGVIDCCACNSHLTSEAAWKGHHSHRVKGGNTNLARSHARLWRRILPGNYAISLLKWYIWSLKCSTPLSILNWARSTSRRTFSLVSYPPFFRRFPKDGIRAKRSDTLTVACFTFLGGTIYWLDKYVRRKRWPTSTVLWPGHLSLCKIHFWEVKISGLSTLAVDISWISLRFVDTSSPPQQFLFTLALSKAFGAPTGLSMKGLHPRI